MFQKFVTSVKSALGMEVKPGDGDRSPEWPEFSRKFLAGRQCAACGRKDNLNAHHCKPFHLFPDLELVEYNLIPLCTKGPGSTNCHCLVGHCGDWKDYNPNVLSDAEFLRAMFKNKVKG